MKVDEILSQPTRPADDLGHRSICESPWVTTKIHPWHLDRLANVYVRQSSPQQVLEHRESAALQYDLLLRAVALGWPADRVVVIDEDQGCSGQTAEGRIGFQRLLAEVSLDHVGIILGIEMSRLARSCKDWHQLLELCAIFKTLLADQDGVYDPCDFNDRLLPAIPGHLRTTLPRSPILTVRSQLSSLGMQKSGGAGVRQRSKHVRIRRELLVWRPNCAPRTQCWLRTSKTAVVVLGH